MFKSVDLGTVHAPSREQSGQPELPWEPWTVMTPSQKSSILALVRAQAGATLSLFSPGTVLGRD